VPAKYWSMPALVLAPLMLAMPAAAQDSREFVVTYVEFLPAAQDHGAPLLERLAAIGRAASGAISFSANQEIQRPNFYVLIEVWNSAAAHQAFQNSPATQALLKQIQPFLEAPFDERGGTLVE
jgi:quinol monooxygenase YgiN